MAEKSIDGLLPDFPVGPLSSYREQSTFDWKKMKLSIDGEEQIRIKVAIWEIFQKSELFHPPKEQMSMSEYRHLIWKRLKFLKKEDFISMRSYANPKSFAAVNEAVMTCDPESGMKFGIMYGMFTHAIQTIGTEKHQKFIDQIMNDEITGCFALTEIAHGSNAKGMQTTATYDPKTKEFVMNSADFRAAKCWAGNLGQCATHAVVYAKLITVDSKDQGLHTFVVPIRCTRTLRAFPGVIVGDMGEKIGLNGIDNGFLMFKSYRISKDALLNKMSDVNDAGYYVSRIRDPSKRFGASLGTLSGGRVSICGGASTMLQKAITIALRYSAVRKQFGPENSTEEYLVIEYQQQQFRLLPYLAAAYSCRIFSNWFSEIYTTFLFESFTGELTSDDAAFKGMEVHALSSGAKPTTSWISRDGIQVCREACGGHGYLQAAGFGKIRGENDANCTYEGENSLLIQQTSNWLLARFKAIQNGEKLVAPYGSDYINDYKNILKVTAAVNSTEQATNPQFLLKTYKWLVCYMLKLTAEKVERLTAEGLNAFDVKNNSQSYHAASLSIIYSEHAILNVAYNHAINIEDAKCRNVLVKLVSLFGAWSLEKHMGLLYMGGYISRNNGQYLRDGILELCHDLKPECISLVDSIAPPDFFLNSVLGNSDGKVYERLQNSFYSYPGSLSRPDWWKDVVKWKKSKL